MYKLVSFPHYTCGGLLCDIFNDTFSDMGTHGAIANVRHSLAKIGDTDTVMTNYDPDQVMNRLSTLVDNSQWVGTHCWPGPLPLDQFQQVLNITTTTARSQFYRWCRAYRHMFRSQWGSISGQDLQDKMRECAKNYLIPFEPVQHPRVHNIEFAEIVHGTAEFISLVRQRSDYQTHLDRWYQYNGFLLKPGIWYGAEAEAFHQAQAENNLKRPYIYDPTTATIRL